MKPPHALIDSLGMCIDDFGMFKHALSNDTFENSKDEIERLWALGLPPIVNLETLSVMTGLHEGFLYSLVNRTYKHYRRFEILKGGGRTRIISSPKVGLKIIQKWLAEQFAAKWKNHENVYGFVKGRSHIDAAKQHLSAKWIYSIDIENFFGTTSVSTVIASLKQLGYEKKDSLRILGSLLTLNGFLPQGSPASPIVSNIAFNNIDNQFSEISKKYGITYTRYADDIVFSGKSIFPEYIEEEVKAAIAETEWKISERKTEKAMSPKRLKVHGLLVHNDYLRLTKGYRKRIRTFKHLLKYDKAKLEDISKIKGHLNYADFISRER